MTKIKAEDWSGYLEWLIEEHPSYAKNYSKLLPIEISQLEEEWLELKKKETT